MTGTHNPCAMFWTRSASADRIRFRVTFLFLSERDGMPRGHTWDKYETPR
jgi:hypothetical protein